MSLQKAGSGNIFITKSLYFLTKVYHNHIKIKLYSNTFIALLMNNEMIKDC